MKRKLFLPKFNLFVIYISLIICISYIFISLSTQDYYKLSTSISGIFLMFLPYILQKIFKFKIPHVFISLYLTFIFFALVLGSVVNLYITISWYDDLMHFISGFLDSILAIYIFNRLVKNNQYNIKFITIFTISFSLAIGVFWEIYEFIDSKITGMDPQNVLTTGVDDTMFDLIFALIGSIIFTYIYKLIIRNRTSLK